jgi:hypothetical protein
MDPYSCVLKKERVCLGHLGTRVVPTNSIRILLKKPNLSLRAGVGMSGNRKVLLDFKSLMFSNQIASFVNVIQSDSFNC